MRARGEAARERVRAPEKKKFNRGHLMDCQNLQRESTCERCFKNDVSAFLIFSSVELERSQHRRDGAPNGRIRGVSACQRYGTSCVSEHTLSLEVCRGSPGHARRPNPKMMSAGSSSVNSPRVSKNRSGLNTSGSG